MTRDSRYIHGTLPEEQSRLSLLNDLTNASFLDFLEIKPGDSVLEAGSGLGILTNSVATRFPDSFITGIEIAPEPIEKARVSFSRTAEGSSFKRITFSSMHCTQIVHRVTLY